MNKLQVYNLFKKKEKIDTGLFLTFEGIDGTGKNTHVNNIANYLKQQGYKVKVIGFPQYDTPIGKVISSYLRGEFGGIKDVPDQFVSLAYASDRATIRDQIEAYLENGYIVLSDRYTYSNIFSAAKMPKEKRREFIEWVERIEFRELKVVRPHYNFYLHIDPSVSQQRIEARGKRDYQQGQEDIYENNFQLLKDTTETYLDWATHRSHEWVIIDQMKNGKQMPIDEVFKMIKSQVDDIVLEFSLEIE